MHDRQVLIGLKFQLENRIWCKLKPQLGDSLNLFLSELLEDQLYAQFNWQILWPVEM